MSLRVAVAEWPAATSTSPAILSIVPGAQRGATPLYIIWPAEPLTFADGRLTPGRTSPRQRRQGSFSIGEFTILDPVPG